MKKRLTALLLALALTLALGASAVLAEDGTERLAAEATDAAQSAETTADTTGETAEPAESAGAAKTQDDAKAQEDGESAQEAEELPEAAPSPDPEGTLSFENLESRIRENNYTLLSLERKIENIDKTDLDKTRQDLVDGLNAIADQQWAMLSIPGVGAMGAGMMQSSYDSLRKQLDDIKSGKTARDLENARRQMAAGEDQLIMSMESAYIRLKAFEEQDAALTRGIAALDRGARAAEVSARNGLVSQLTLEQLKTQRAQLVSTQATLRMGIDTGVMNLKAMVGEELDAPMTLAALPKVTAKQLEAMDTEADLARAKEASAELFDAKATLEDAREVRKDAGYSTSANRTWEAAQYTYKAAEQSFELKFRTLCAQVKDNAQKLSAAKSALALEEKNYKVAALKSEQGSISANALADAKDTLADAKDAVASAERDLLTSYRSYYWAVEHGILN